MSFLCTGVHVVLDYFSFKNNDKSLSGEGAILNQLIIVSTHTCIEI